MTLEELYEALDIECPEDFKFYENFEAYIELDGDIDSEILVKLFSKIDKDYFTEMLEGYFEGLINFVCEFDSSFSMELEKEKYQLLGLWENTDSDNEESFTDFVIEIENFRKFYVNDSEVVVLSDDNEETATLLDSYWVNREDKFEGKSHSFNFSKIKFTVDEYSMTINDLVSRTSFDDEEEIEDDYEN